MTNDEGMTKSDIGCGNLVSFWAAEEMAFVREESDAKPVYDLEERTARFGESVIDFAKTIPQGAVTNRILSQLIGAATSVGANYVEADDAVSKKEFLKSVGMCRKEARETKHFVRMTVRAVPELKSDARKLWVEARELHLIFSRIGRSGKINNDTTMFASRPYVRIRASSFLRASSFAIRHFVYATRH
jgi:four helix bundle protein